MGELNSDIPIGFSMPLSAYSASNLLRDLHNNNPMLDCLLTFYKNHPPDLDKN